MKSFTNVGKPKKTKDSSTKEKVISTFNKAEEKGAQHLAADTEAAEGYETKRKAMAERFESPNYRKETKRADTKELQASRSYYGKNTSSTETARVKGLKETGFYGAKPAVIGGTKKMLVRSKKNVKRSAASPQAKRQAKKLY